MLHPVVDRIRQVLPPPPSGGDMIDWEMLAHSTGWEFPTDYRELVELYGGGEIDEYLSVRTPPVEGSPFGSLLEGVDPALPRTAVPSWPPVFRLMRSRGCCRSARQQPAMSCFG